MDSFQQLMSTLDPPMIVVTTAVGTERAGCLVGFHSQSSINPGRYVVWLSKANHTSRVAQLATTFAVHFLAHDQRDLAVHFGTQSGDDVDKFADLQLESVDGSVPLLTDCPNRFWGRKATLLDEGGDHLCVVIDPIEAAEVSSSFRCLRLSDVSDLDASHDAEERNHPPTERAAGRG
ncbi:MAG: flavin reductase family protein [Microthrixaceae bacterium]